MEERERERKSGGLGCAITGIVVILLLALYVLSSGPAAFYTIQFGWPTEIFRAVYWPFVWGGENVGGFAEIRDWYWSLWGV